MNFSTYSDGELVSMCRIIQSVLKEREIAARKAKHIQALEGPEVIDDHGRTRLMRAVSNGDIELVNILLDIGDSIDKTTTQGYTALYWAINHGQYDIADCLLKRGANITYKTCSNQTLLQIADIYKDVEMQRILRRYGAK
jgi:ankyrin repeat protein